VIASFRLLTYRHNGGAVGAVCVAGTVYDLAYALPDLPGAPSVLGVLEDWPCASAALARLVGDTGRLAAMPGRKLETLELLPPVLYPNGIYCAGANYKDHVAEMSKAFNVPAEPDPHDIGMPPWLFIKTARNTMVGHRARVAIPSYSKKMDWELEVAAVIGRSCKDVSVDHAMDYVAGYTLINDLSARDFLKRPKATPGSPFEYDWISQKNFDGACPIGPWIVPRDDIADPMNLALKLWVSGELMQDSNTSQMIFNYAELIAFLSSRFTLYPGDIVATGTPAGVGTPRGRFLKRGDEVRIAVEGIGELCTTIG
jgi:2-keto-4-pentenoate hydratase/2-oxohepta-3-ene-1,7-dioic acid hydratase in catechol pathway